MTNSKLTIEMEGREVTGRAVAPHRAEGKLPVVVYGAGAAPGNYFVDARSFEKIWKEAGESTMVSLSYDGKQKDALIHDVQVDPLKQTAIHADFYLVDENKPVEVAVPLEFEGVSPAVKNLGGVLVKVMHEVEISVLPKELPQHLVVDLTKLEDFESRVTAGDIELPNSASLVTDAGDVVVLAEEPKEEVEEEAPADITAVEVEKKGKEEEAPAAE